MTGDNPGAGETRRLFRRLHGAEIRSKGGVRFRLWVPAHKRISLSLEPESQTKASAMSPARMRMSRSLPFVPPCHSLQELSGGVSSRRETRSTIARGVYATEFARIVFPMPVILTRRLA